MSSIHRIDVLEKRIEKLRKDIEHNERQIVELEHRKLELKTLYDSYTEVCTSCSGTGRNDKGHRCFVCKGVGKLAPISCKNGHVIPYDMTYIRSNSLASCPWCGEIVNITEGGINSEKEMDGE